MKKKYFLLLLAIASLTFGCTQQTEPGNQKIVDDPAPVVRDTFHKLCQYWSITDAENPTFRDVYDEQVAGTKNYPGIVFMTDSTFLENPKSNMRYGEFVLKGKTIDATFDDGEKAVYTIQTVQGDTMELRRAEKDHTTKLYVSGDRAFLP